jgi:O-antigen ligase
MTISVKHRIVDMSTLARIEGWRVSFPMMLKYPFGVGGACFPYIWVKMSKYCTFFLSCSHHLFLSIGTEFGVIPLILFIFIVLIYLYKCIYVVRRSKDKDLSSLSFALLIGIMAYISYGIISEGQLAHLTSWREPIHSHSVMLFSLLSIISFLYRRVKYESY